MLEFTDRDSTNLRLRNNNSGKEESYELIKVFEFESDRKCMTVIVKDEAGKYWAYCKGADSSILPKITHCKKEDPMMKSIPDFEEGQKFDHLDKARSEACIAELKTCDSMVETMARKGLRTLCYARKEIPDWSAEIDPQELKPSQIECDMHMLAVTAVEDLLQDDVKSCIEDFRRAKISVWMLTGDKGLTAEEIGVACGLMPQKDGPEDVVVDTLPQTMGNLPSEGNVV